jgi:cysteine desulfurase
MMSAGLDPCQRTVRIYFDHNATTPLAGAARAAMVRALDRAGNPSSVHTEGRAARDLVEAARRQVAAWLGGEPDEVVFTSGGTEADVLGVVGLARAARGAGRLPRVMVAPIEHPAVLGAAEALVAEGFAVERLVVDADGRVDGADLARRLAGGGAVVAVAAANHELGTRQDIAALAAMARAAGWWLHVDAVQLAGKAPLPPVVAAADAVAVSAHKIGGPAGVGALWVRRGIDLAAVSPAGHQERERRPGTENVVGIAGFAAAVELADPARYAAVAGLAERLEAGLLALPGVAIQGRGAPRVGNTVNARFAGARGEAIVIALDLAGVAVSTGAACTSGSVKPSPVLLALGLGADEAREAVRFSLGPSNTADEVDRVLALLGPIVDRARRHR